MTIRKWRWRRPAAAVWAVCLFLPIPAFAQPAVRGEYRKSVVRRQELVSWLFPVLDRLGDRFEKPGKELTTMAGLIRWQGGGASPLELTLEYPGRITIRDEGRNRVVVFDRRAKQHEALPDPDAALVNTLLFASADHFFDAGAEAAGMRAVGRQFAYTQRTVSGEQTRYFDVYELTERSPFPGSTEWTVRVFCFDSFRHELTLVLEPRTKAETEYSDWRPVQGQAAPGKIVRRQNGQEVFSLEIRQSSFQARVNN